MTRTTLIIGALIFALAAAGVLVWTGVIDPSMKQPTVQGVDAPALPSKAPATTQASATGEDAKWIEQMNQVAASGGVAVTFQDESVDGWRLPPGHKLERFSVAGSQTVFSRLTSSVVLSNDPPTWPDRGLSYQFPVQLNNQTNGGQLEVGVVVRSARQNGSDHVNIVYATQQAGHSGWQKLGLNSEFQLLTFNYDVPSLGSGYTNQSIVVLHSDDTGAGRAIEILGVYVKPLPR